MCRLASVRVGLRSGLGANIHPPTARRSRCVEASGQGRGCAGPAPPGDPDRAIDAMGDGNRKKMEIQLHSKVLQNSDIPRRRIPLHQHSCMRLFLRPVAPMLAYEFDANCVPLIDPKRAYDCAG